MSKASNIQKMIDYLKVKECVTRDELATLLNVKKSTISNYVGDINADHHYLIEASTGRYGGYRLKHYDMELSFDKSEIEALVTTRNIIEKVRPEIFPELNLLTDKLLQLYKIQVEKGETLSLDYYKSAHGANLSSAADRKREAKIKKAILEKRQLDLEYIDVKKNCLKRRFDPYEIVSFKSSTYVAGYCHLRGEFRIFKLNRIQSVKYSDQTFELKTLYDLDKILENTLGVHVGTPTKIKLRIISPFDVIIGEKQWVDDQVIHRESDEAIIFEGTVSDDEETITWLLSMKSYVEILEPMKLKKKYLETIQKIYEKNFI